MFIEVHFIQNFAPSNLNRDDTNSPKDCEFGGVRRARISSQCLKRAIRLHPLFARTTQVEVGVRTRWLNRKLREELEAAGKDPAQAKDVAEAFSAKYCKLDGNHTSVLLYVSKTEIQNIIAQLLSRWDEIIPRLGDKAVPAVDEIAKELFKALKQRTSAPDIAMFGRMLAENADLNIDAACQVAHAISTHRVNMEMDFYTAADDLALQSETGAGMMGTTGFNSACFYRYARIDWEQLVKNLDGDISLARRAVEGFLRAAEAAIPTGKQNSFAAQNRPSLLMVVVRPDDQGWSLANAFEKPVTPDRDGGLIAPSIRALDAYWGRMVQVYGDQGLSVFVLLLDAPDCIQTLAPHVVNNFKTWIEQAIAALPAG